MATSMPVLYQPGRQPHTELHARQTPRTLTGTTDPGSAIQQTSRLTSTRPLDDES
jgi:hypothetical protein